MSLARQQRQEHVAAPAKPFDVDAEIAALEPGEREAARRVPGDVCARCRRAARDRDPRL